MATLLTATGLARLLPSRTLFEGVSIHIEERDRIGLIGPNGGGKSTLLRMLAGLEAPDGGEIVRRRSLRVAFVPQEDRFDPGVRVGEAATAAAAALEGEDGPDPATRAAIVLDRLGFADPDATAASLSGGWRKRLSLACGLVRDPELLLLDEPTNHLDLDGVAWLEGFVRHAPMAVVFVSHDRSFLEATATRIVELSAAYPGGSFEAEGDYSRFLERREAFLEAAAAAQASLANKVRRDEAWMRQGVQARRTRNRSQVDAAAERRRELDAGAARAAVPQRTASIEFAATERKTRRLLAMQGVAAAFGERRLFGGVDLELAPGDRLGVLGENGVGKTTLLRILEGELAPLEGRVERAANLRVGIFGQHRGTLDPARTLQETLCPIGDRIEMPDGSVHVSGWAKRFLFEPSQLATPVGHLSGGEQARLVIATLMATPADLLILDEPTNDLDIPSLEVLEQALRGFPGAIVLVSHDRFLLDRVCTGFLGFDGRGSARLFATREQWERDRVRSDPPPSPAGSPPSAPAPPRRGGSRPRKLAYREQQELAGMEEAILAAEAEISRLEAETNDPAVLADHSRSAAAFASLAAASERVRSLYERWAELERIAAGESEGGA